MQIRRATPADAEVWVTTLVESMCTAYATLMPPQFADTHRARIPEMIQARREAFAADGDGGAWLAIDDLGVVAVADAGPGPASWEVANGLPPAPESWELFKLYALERGLGSGAGQQLLDAAIGDRPAYLWMMANNPRAQRFYQRNGFRPDGVTAASGPSWCYRPMLRLHRAG